MLLKHFTILQLLFISMAVFPQGGHYWTEQYGTRSILMSSAVIGGVEDLGAVYYNPGRLPLPRNGIPTYERGSSLGACRADNTPNAVALPWWGALPRLRSRLSFS